MLAEDDLSKSYVMVKNLKNRIGITYCIGFLCKKKYIHFRELREGV